MIMKRLLPTVVCIAMLSACAGPAPAPALKPASVDTAMLEVDAAVKAGNNERAFALLKSAATSFPTDKTPWLRMAQLRFDNASYGEAIVNGLEALERDPEDVVAYSLVAVSGLRVSSKALADLTQKNNLSGSVRSEAQDLAKLLRTSLGEEHLVIRQPPRTTRAGARTVAAPLKAATGSDPFGALK